MKKAIVFAVAVMLGIAAGAGEKWPEPVKEMRPWAINHWLGSSVDEANLAREIGEWAEAGLGGIRVIPLYGVRGVPEVEYLSPRWLELFGFARAECRRHGMGVQAALGTGWCFGGPTIPPERGVHRLKLLRAGERVTPGAEVLARGADWTLIARPTRQKVKRAGPGGEGWMMNPLDPEAMRANLIPFDRAHADGAVPKPDFYHHDSFEYYDIGWSKTFRADFKRLRGYDLAGQYAALAGQGDAETVARVKYDYRRTVSDLIIDEVFPVWKDWCRRHGIGTVNQAHGATANILDFYTVCDIPETEIFARDRTDPRHTRFDRRPGERDINFSKFASSSAHLTGRRLVSAEALTWLAEHFQETPEAMKVMFDQFFLAGINHLFLHGVTYSPAGEPWPGYVFYAATQVNARNPLWRDLKPLFAYVTRAQSLLQTARPDNDVLVYWPIHDLWSKTEGFAEMMEMRNDDIPGSAFGETARELAARGYSYDFVSDRLLERPETTNGTYRAVVVPTCAYLPETTLARLLALAEAGLDVCFVGAVAGSVPGLADRAARQAELDRLRSGIAWEAAADGTRVCRRGTGAVRCGELPALLRATGARAERAVAALPQIGHVRLRRGDGKRLYFYVNTSDTPLRLAFAAGTTLMDPLTGAIAAAPADGWTLEGHASVFAVSDDAEPLRGTARPRASDEVRARFSPWRLEFVAGGPELPAARELAALGDWAKLDAACEAFSGTARYTARFDCADAAEVTALDLGAVAHTARVRLNGRELGTVFMRPYRLAVPAGVLRVTGNTLEVEVTNLGANRLRDLDRRGVIWRRFKDCNFRSITYKPFDASVWPVFPSGLSGPVRLCRDNQDTEG